MFKTSTAQAKTRILVTGIDGMTGAYVVEALRAQAYELHGLVHSRQSAQTLNLRYPDVTCHVANLQEPEAVNCAVAETQPNQVLHLAAVAFVGHADADAFYRVNLIGTRHLLAALATLPIAPRKIVLASSANIYGNTSISPINEQVVPQPVNDYAVSKLAMEHMARLWMNRLPIVIARPFNYTGVGQSEQFLLPKIVAHFKTRQPLIELGNLDVARDFSDVRWIAQAYVALLESALPGEIYNLCSGTGHALEAVLSMLTELSGHTLEVKVNPQFVRANEVKRLVGDNRKLMALMSSPPIALKETLRWMLESPASSSSSLTAVTAKHD